MSFADDFAAVILPLPGSSDGSLSGGSPLNSDKLNIYIYIFIHIYICLHTYTHTLRFMYIHILTLRANFARDWAKFNKALCREAVFNDVHRLLSSA